MTCDPKSLTATVVDDYGGGKLYPVKIGGAAFQKKYLELIRRLPGARRITAANRVAPGSYNR